MKSDSENRPQKGASIFLKSVTASVLVALMTLAVFAWTIVSHEKAMLLEQLEERGNLLASSLDRVTAKAIVAEDWEAVISQCLSMIESGEHVDYVVVTRKSDGFSLIHTEYNWTLEELTSDWSRNESPEGNGSIRPNPLGQGNVMHYSHPFSYSGIDWGWIHVGLTLNDFDRNINEVIGIIFRLTIPALALGIVVAFIFAQQFTKPISELKQFAATVSSGDLDHQVPIRSHDEIGTLAAAMNQMTRDLKQSQAQLQASIEQEAQLREKEILLKEIHHRVKNNMQILTSLLRMQARQVDNDQVKTFLLESQARVRSMGLIHEKLYQSKNISEIDFRGYVETLAGELVRMRSPEHPIKLSVEIDDIHLGLDTALPCGLIVNELVSNCLKYAFPEDQSGQIKISVQPTEEAGQYRLQVADDGVGLGPSGQPKRTGSLGTKLVEMLVDQLDGEISYHNGIGTRVEIDFRESEYTERM